MMLSFVILLSAPRAFLACSPLPSGQEKRLTFQAEGLAKIPVQFAYTLDQTSLTSFPNFARTATEAVTKLTQEVKTALTAAIAEEAVRAGIQNQVFNIANQISPTVYYNPMNCSKAGAQAQQPQQGMPGYVCVVKTDSITNVAYDANTLSDVPLTYQSFIVSLGVSNYIIGGWSRDMWELTLLKAQRQLKNSTQYGTSFRTVTLTLI